VNSSFKTLLLICCVLTYAGYLGSYMRLPVVPLYARSIGADTVQIGLINSSFLLMAGLLSMPLGLLSDRLGRRALVLTGLLISAGTSFLLCLVHTATQMIWIYLLFGVGLAAFAPTMMSLVADISPVTHLGRAYGWYTMAVYGGMSLGPAAGGLVAEWWGYKPVFLLSGVWILLVCLAVFRFLPESLHLRTEGSQKKPVKALARNLVKNLPLLACWLVTLGGCLGLGMFVTFIPVHAHEQGIPVGQIGLIFASQALSNALCRIPFGRLSDSVGQRSHLVVVGLIGLAMSIAGFGLATNIMLFISLAIGMGISMGLAFTAIGALISEVVSPESRGLAMGGYNTAIYFGMMLSSLVMGVVIRSLGFPIAFFIVAGVNLLTTGLFYWMFGQRRHTETGPLDLPLRSPE
jgi:MFS transporter, DHA1 family, multidrug resistance protein